MSALSFHVRWLHGLVLVSAVAMITVALGTMMAAGPPGSSVYDFTLPSIDGDPTPLATAQVGLMVRDYPNQRSGVLRAFSRYST